jgi:hypothetical protein
LGPPLGLVDTPYRALKDSGCGIQSDWRFVASGHILSVTYHGSEMMFKDRRRENLVVMRYRQRRRHLVIEHDG